MLLLRWIESFPRTGGAPVRLGEKIGVKGCRSQEGLWIDHQSPICSQNWPSDKVFCRAGRFKPHLFRKSVSNRGPAILERPFAHPNEELD